MKEREERKTERRGCVHRFYDHDWGEEKRDVLAIYLCKSVKFLKIVFLTLRILTESRNLMREHEKAMNNCQNNGKPWVGTENRKRSGC